MFGDADADIYGDGDVDMPDVSSFMPGFGRSLNVAAGQRGKNTKPQKANGPEKWSTSRPVKKPVKKPLKKPAKKPAKKPSKKPMKIVLKKMSREKSPKEFATPEKLDHPKTMPGWVQNDLFYPKSLLQLMANSGVDISGFQPIQGKVNGDEDSRAIVSTASKWSEIDAADDKIIVPYTFHADFPWKTEVNFAVAEMNEDLGCVKVVLVPEAEVTTANAPFVNGIVFAFEDITGNGCYSSLGKAPGFIGRAADDGFTDITAFGVPAGWQLLSLGAMDNSNCDGTDKATIKHELLHAMGFHHEHNRPDRATFLNVDMGATESDAQFELMSTGGWVC